MTTPNLTNLRRRPIDQLYHQFLKAENIPKDKLDALVTLLQEANFISPVLSTSQRPQYVETSKLNNRQDNDELFKLVRSLKE